jgi:hypothetical protein
MILRIFILSIILTSCEYENLELNNKNKISYSKDILPIISLKCSITSCHVPGSPTGDFLVYDELKKRIENNKFQRMVFELKLMPPAMSRQLNEDEIEILRLWIEQGSPE